MTLKAKRINVAQFAPKQIRDNLLPVTQECCTTSASRPSRKRVLLFEEPAFNMHVRKKKKKSALNPVIII